MWKLHCFLLTYISLRNLLVLLLVLVLAVLLVVSEHGGRPEQAASKS